LWACQPARAQSSKTNTPAIPQGDINKKDTKGKKTGMWLVSMPARMGEAGYSEFGTYDEGNKAGLWYKLDGEGRLTSIETYRNNVLDGEVKYYENGRVTCIGYYRGLNPRYSHDTIDVIDPVSHKETRRIIPTERSTLKHGTWRFYDADNGRLVREEDYQIDELVYHKDYPMSKADSLIYLKRESKMPHNKKKQYAPPPAKQVTYN
jgi:antitoxin component YwqK of YwqJK toxin-antitoxin module